MSEELTAEQQASLDELAALINVRPAHEEGKIFVVYASVKVGKTTTFAQFKDGVLVEAKDNSAAALKESGDIRPDYPVIVGAGYHNVLDVLRLLVKTKAYRHITIDGGSGMHEWSDKLTIDNDFDGDRSKFSDYGRGDKPAGFLWDDFVDLLREARAAGIWIYVLCHKEVTTEKNPGGSDYLKNAPAMSKIKRAKLMRYADALLFMDFQTDIEKVNKQSNVGKAIGGEVRVMYCKPSASYEAGNRLGLPSEILLGDSPQEAYRALGAALKAGKKKTGENQ